jgi:sulfur carrier protein ThiS
MQMIEVTLQMTGALCRFLPDGQRAVRLSVPDGSTIADLVDAVGARGEVWLVAVNGSVRRISDPVASGDVIDCFSVMEGG